MTTYAVNLYRFSDQPERMIAFYEALGLVKRVSSGGFALLEAGAGWVAVHTAAGSDTGAQPGETQLVLLASDGAEAAAADLEKRGLAVRLWDESYGKQAAITTPLGSDVWVNEHQEDLYGYEGHAGGEPSPLVVTAVYYSSDFDRDAAWFTRLGFEKVGAGDEWWQALDSGSGRVGLHRADETYPECTATTATVGAGFETAEPLEDVAARLRAAGYEAQVVSDEYLTAVHVTDPDGVELQIHPLS